MDTLIMSMYKLIEQLLPDLVIMIAMGSGFVIRGMVK
jgi:hypothetical protein